MAFEKAVRRAAPMLISLSGPSGSGKTYSALKLAAGIAGPNGRVGMIDTENGRGRMYADSPGIMAAFPNGYEVDEIAPPYGPERYIEKLQEAERCGINVCVVDSASHEYEGIGGICEIAENNKLKGMPNWALAKRLHKRFVNHCLSSSMHIIFCLRARDKVKIVKDEKGRDQFIPIGIIPIAEKNFVYEMLLSLQIDEQTHFAKPIKVPEPLVGLFPAAHLITKEDGARIREWNETGRAIDDHEQLKKRARAIAEDGMEAYETFFAALPKDQKKALADSIHAELKATAERIDRERTAEPEFQNEGFTPEPAA